MRFGISVIILGGGKIILLWENESGHKLPLRQKNFIATAEVFSGVFTGGHWV